ncbi:MAG: alpha/beta hydrolase family protein [Roseobacter sp.]
MKNTILSVIMTLLATDVGAAPEIGLVTFSAYAPHHNEPMQIAVMYPTNDAAQPMLFAENAVFLGTPVVQNAEPRAGQYPLVMVSHGWGSTYDRMAWLSAGLAAKGAIVVSVNHPNSTAGDVEMEIAFQHWTRAQDLSVALNVMVADATFGGMIDDRRIYVTGFSYGGWTALSLAGVRGNWDGFFDYCAAAGSGSRFCTFLAADGTTEDDIDTIKYEASYKDNRIKAAAAIDPGLTWRLRPKDVSDVSSSLL